MDGDRYVAIGGGLGFLAGAATFIGSWIYCIVHYGFLLGVGLGWLPSAIVAAIVAVLVTFLLGVAAVLIVVAIIAAMMDHGTKANDPSAAIEAAPTDNTSATAAYNDPATSPGPLTSAADAAADAVATSSYQDLHGDDDCTGDCSGHNAGYDWARDHGTTDQDECGGESQSFIEGCQAYVEDNN